MNLAVSAKSESRKAANLLILPFWKDKKGAVPVIESKKLYEPVSVALETGDFKGKEKEILIIYVQGQPEKRFALLGLGEKEKLTTEALRRAYSSAAKACHQRKIKDINVLVPAVAGMQEESIVRGIVEGLLLTNYAFDKLKCHSIEENPTVLLEKITLVGASKQALELAQKIKIICEGVYLARDLVNSNADEVTPQHLTKLAETMAHQHRRVKATIFDKRRIEKEKMGLLLAVSRGSAKDPAFIMLEYKGSPKAKEHIVLVGKGVTYDTGGLNLKLSSMETMKCDMGGAAAVLATLSVAAKLELPIHLTVIVPATENCISEHSYKPGDVYAGYSGKTVEIGNTDAEGRLILADALAYAVKNLNPTHIIDVATLTGAIDIALGNETTGLMSNNDALCDLLIRAGSETYERVWRLPIYEEYKDHLKSDIADMKNIGTRSASAIIAAIFLQNYVEKVSWAHLDIASTAWMSESKRYHPKFGTGVGVRLLIEFLQHL